MCSRLVTSQPADVQDWRRHPRPGPGPGREPARGDARPGPQAPVQRLHVLSLVTSRNRMLLAEFDYDSSATPSIPFIKHSQARYDMWLLKRYGCQPVLEPHGEGLA